MHKYYINKGQIFCKIYHHTTLYDPKSRGSGAMTSNIEWRDKNYCVGASRSGLYFHEQFSKNPSAVSKVEIRYTLTDIHRQDRDFIRLLIYFPWEVNYRKQRRLKAKNEGRMNKYFAQEGLLRFPLYITCSVWKKNCLHV
jgi:hypothetical protein